MKKRMKKNRKGSVLLTVICFTTVCMLIATTALSLANYSNRNSNSNVQKTQAAITAEECLEQFIGSFGTSSNAYDDLANLAGTDKANANAVSVSMDGDSDADSTFGSCMLYIYKDASGNVIVESEATYAQETASTKAVFKTDSNNPYESENAIETSDGLNTNGVSLPVSGDLLIESSAPNGCLYLHNDQGVYHSNIYVDQNVYIDTNVKFNDTIKSKAMTLTSTGYIAWKNSPEFRTDMGKSVSASDSSKLSNKDGYINSDKKIIIGNPTTTTLDAGKDIDVYCRGIYIGGIPDTVMENGSSVTITDKAAIKAAFNGYPNFGQQAGKFQMRGNLYSYKGTDVTNEYQDGNIVFYNMNSATIYGSIYCDGNIYLSSCSKLTIQNGGIYCTGKIYDKSGIAYGETGFDSNQLEFIGIDPATNALGTVSTTIDTTIERNQKPDMNYDPATGKVRSSTSQYQNATPNDIFLNSIGYKRVTDFSGNVTLSADTPDQSSKQLGNKYRNAYDVNWKSVAENYDGTENSIRNGNINITDSCKLDSNLLIQNAKFTIQLKDHDVVILFPVGGSYSDLKIIIDVSQRQNNSFCYFMLYDPNNDIDSNFGESGVLYTSKTEKITSLNIINNSSIFQNDVCAGFNDTPASSNGTNNKDVYTFWMLPDGCTMTINNAKVQGIVYGPKADFCIAENNSQLFGQAKVKKFQMTNNSGGKNNVVNMSPADDSILSFINYANPSSQTVELMYYKR